MTGIPRDRGDEHPWFQTLKEREMALLDPEVRADRSLASRFLHDDFLEFGSTGRVYNRKVLLDMLEDEQPSPVVIRDFAVRQLSNDTALVTYRTVGQGGQEARRSSVWVLHEGTWKMMFHQGTRISHRY